MGKRSRAQRPVPTRITAFGSRTNAGRSGRLPWRQIRDHRCADGAPERDRRTDAGAATRDEYRSRVGTIEFSLSRRRNGDALQRKSYEGATMTNKSLILALMVVFVMAAGGYGLYRLGMNHAMRTSGMTSDVSAAASAAAGAQEPGDSDPTTGKKVLYWHDPMVPGQKFDKPGKSPFMDMQLVPVYADGGSDQGAVAISPRVQQNLGVRIAEVKSGSQSSTMEAVGSVAYNERDVAVVQARSNGFLERLYVRAPLDPVRQGQPLAELYVPDWVAAQEEYLSAKRIVGQTPGRGIDGLVDGARQRLRLAGMSDEQIRRIETSDVVQARTTLTAPISGVVTELPAREGMTVMAGAPLFRINGLSTIWLNAEVPENLAAMVRPGNPVEARATALPGVTLKGKVSAILPEVNPATRTLKARVELANPGNQLV